MIIFFYIIKNRPQWAILSYFWTYKREKKFLFFLNTYLTHPPWGCVCLFSFWGFPHTFLRFFLINFHHIKASNLIFVCEFFSDQEQHNGGSFVGCSIKEYRKKTKKRISDFWWVSLSFFLPAKFLKNRTNIFFTFRTNSSRNAS